MLKLNSAAIIQAMNVLPTDAPHEDRQGLDECEHTGMYETDGHQGSCGGRLYHGCDQCPGE